ncbi:C40 family peptidase [Frankia sp. CNm7]|uniref:C40 family peptidase n=2 Tax=Frankia nepalensis TaxID=1836974 RepID=A0A937RDP7_9ACTN|nr:C40 family peptidase [Frankia nepalensis]MBL7511586.1 C40 family peptidase [Frankia nepalensis]MBL7520644.1 C40 family peptidase [Frankia nepalensis]MBL7630261.1 C40 family peptidase [Frankia nepalensis]
MAPAWASPGAPSPGASANADPGGADTLEGLSAQIEATRAELAALDTKLAAAAEAFNASRLRLGQARTAVTDAEARVDRADAVVQEAVQKRRGLSASAYRATGLDTLSALLTGDPGGALDRVGALDALARRARAAEAEERLARVDLTEARAAAQMTLVAAQGAFDEVTERKREIETSASQQRTLLDGLIAKQRDLEREAREREAAARRAQELAAAANAARIAEAAAAEQRQLRQQADLANQAGQQFAGAPVAPAPAPSVPGPPAGGGGAATAVAEAYRQLGKPYVWGAEGPDSFDCSGLSQWVWAKAGVHLTHYTGAQWNEGRRVSRAELIPGDLVFFHSNLDHLGIYVGDGKMIHAPHTGAVVRVEDVWWSSFQGGVRPTG